MNVPLRPALLTASLLLAAKSLAAPVPLTGSKPVDVRTIRQNNPAVLPMDGTWRFQLTRGRIVGGTFRPAKETPNEDAFVASEYDDKAWKDIPVPANWEMEGFSKPSYNEPDDAVGLYRREVAVPKSFAGKRVLWHFDGVFAGAEVWVNGARVGYHESGYSAFDMDVTSAIKPGERNVVALRVSKTVPSSPLDSGDYWALGGIYRENYMVAVPKLSVDDVLVRTDLDAKYKDATFRTAVKVVGAPGGSFRVSGQLYRRGGEAVPSGELAANGIVGKDGTTSVNLSQFVGAPRLWSAEKPNLYYVVLTLQKEGKAVERVQERFGFRKIEIQNGVLLWNGVAIKATGTCRHEEWAVLGHALNEKAWQTDVALIKAANINAVRTSHYNHAQRFLEICEEKGLYLLDEAAGCWADMKDASLKPWMVLHAQEMYARDKNRPCVMAWSIGNESGVGPVNLAAFEWIKKADPTRPAFISWASTWADSRIDFDDRHYPSLADLKGLAVNADRKTTPLLLSEQPHMYYGSESFEYDPGFHEAWVISLQNNWDVIWKAPGIVGSYLWEWQDQGLKDKFLGDQGRDPKTGLRENNEKGLVDGFRNPKGEYYDVKMVYSPIVVGVREFAASGGAIAVPLENRYAFTDLSELTCRWQALAGDKVLAQGKRSLPLAPMAKGAATFARTPGMDTLRLEFVHADGRTVYTTRLAAKGTSLHPEPLPSAVFGAVSVQDGAEVRIAQGASEIVVDKATGLVRSWRVGGVDVVTSGPYLNLGERRKPGGPLSPRGFLASKAWPTLKNASVTVKGSAVTVTGDVFLAESAERKGVFAYTLSLGEDGQADVSWTMEWDAANANAWELGVRFVLPSASNTLRWSRDAAWTEYPKGHPGAPEGSATSGEVAFRGTKRDVRWALLSGGAYGLEAVRGATPLHLRARPEDGGIVLYTSSAVEPPKNHNESTPELDIHLVKGATYRGDVRLRIVKG